MMERLNNIFNVWNKVYYNFTLINFFKQTRWCFIIYLLVGALYAYLEYYPIEKLLILAGKQNYKLFLFISIILISFLLIFFHLKIFFKKVTKQFSLDTNKYKIFSDYYLNYKYQLLKKYFNEENLKITSSDIALVKNYINTKNLSLVEKNPVFVVSFAILLAILSSGNLNNGKDLYILAFFFILSIFGIIFSFQLHPLFSFNKDKQLLFLLEILVKENEHQNDQLGGE